MHALQGNLCERAGSLIGKAAKLRINESRPSRRTARRLGVHENTIKNRVRVIAELRGHPADWRVAETLLALRLARLTDHDQS